MPTLHSHTITHSLFIFNGVRECFAFAKPHKPFSCPKIVLHKKEAITAPGFIPIWDGAEHVGGVYYYALDSLLHLRKRELVGMLHW